jgi:hypothetical protein
MNCATHPEMPAIAYCRNCGKPLCDQCQRFADGTVFCSEHAPAAAASTQTAGESYSPYTAPPTAPPPPLPDAAGASPGLAFLLGLIPGVGAIYNGQYVKGLIHVVILGVLISIVSSGEASGGLEPLFGMMIAAWVFYMAFEAYHTARKRQLGHPVDEFSSIVPLKGRQSRFPVAPAFLIAVGLLFLLNNLEIIRFGQLLRYWPVALIGLGAYMLYARLAPEDQTIGRTPREVTHERR